MSRKVLFVPIAITAILIGLYPLMYVFVPHQYTFLGTKIPELLKDKLWMSAFYFHIIFGGLALLVGWIQFLPKIRLNKPFIHRKIGLLYILSVFTSSIAGIYMGFFANEGAVASLGFIILGIIWLGSTLQAFNQIKKGRINSHQKWMIFSYAACFSAVTLRIYLPLLNISFEPSSAYKIVAWLCWVPNIMVAAFISRKWEL